MKTLRDQLLKAGLVNKKQARKAQQEKRVERKSKGIKHIEEEKKRKEKEWQNRQGADRRNQQQIALKQQEKGHKKEQWLQYVNIIKQAAKKRDWHGKRKFHFVTRRKIITHLFVSEKIAQKLEDGHMAIVEIPDLKDEQFAPINSQAALKIQSIRPDFILFFNSNPVDT